MTLQMWLGDVNDTGLWQDISDGVNLDSLKERYEAMNVATPLSFELMSVQSSFSVQRAPTYRMEVLLLEHNAADPLNNVYLYHGYVVDVEATDIVQGMLYSVQLADVTGDLAAPVDNGHFPLADFANDTSIINALFAVPGGRADVVGAWDTTEISGPYLTYTETQDYDDDKTVADILNIIAGDSGPTGDVEPRRWWVTGEWADPTNPPSGANAVIRVLHYQNDASLGTAATPLTSSNLASGWRYREQGNEAATAVVIEGPGYDPALVEWSSLVRATGQEGRLRKAAGIDAWQPNTPYVQNDRVRPRRPGATGTHYRLQSASVPGTLSEPDWNLIEGGSTSTGQPVNLDTFTKANSAALGASDSGIEVQLLGQDPAWTIDTNRAKPVQTGADTNFSLAVWDSATAEGTVSVTMRNAAGSGLLPGGQGLAFRVQDASNFWLIESSGGTLWRLRKIVAGADTAVDQWAGATNNDDIVSVVLSGNSIDVRINGVSRITTSDAFNNTATKHGLAIRKTSTPYTARYDAFSHTIPYVGGTWVAETWDAGGVSTQVLTEDGGEVVYRVEQAMLAHDSFNRQNSGTQLGNADSGQAWDASVAAGSVTWRTTGTQAYCAVAGANSVLSLDVGTGEQIVQCVFSTVELDSSRLVVRMTDINNMIFLRADSDGKLRLYRKKAGTTVEIGASTTTATSGGRPKLSCEGDTIKAYWNEAGPIISVTESFNRGATRCGIGVKQAGTARFDDVKAWHTYGNRALFVGSDTSVPVGSVASGDFGFRFYSNRTYEVVESGVVRVAVQAYAQDDSFRIHVKRYIRAGVARHEVRYFRMAAGTTDWRLLYLSTVYPTVSEASPLRVLGMIYDEGAHLTTTTIQRFTRGKYYDDREVTPGRTAIQQFGTVWADGIIKDDSLDTEVKRQAHARWFFSLHTLRASLEGRTTTKYTVGERVPVTLPQLAMSLYAMPLTSAEPDRTVNQDPEQPWLNINLGTPQLEPGDVARAVRIGGGLLVTPRVPTNLQYSYAAPETPTRGMYTINWQESNRGEQYIEFNVLRVVDGELEPYDFIPGIPFNPNFHNLTGLPLQSAYMVQARSRGFNGRPSQWSAPIDLPPIELPVPDEPTNLTQGVHTWNEATRLWTFTLTWDKSTSEGIEYQEIRYGTVVIRLDADLESYTDTIPASSSRTYLVQAISVNGTRSEFSNPETVSAATTPAMLPPTAIIADDPGVYDAQLDRTKVTISYTASAYTVRGYQATWEEDGVVRKQWLGSVLAAVLLMLPGSNITNLKVEAYGYDTSRVAASTAHASFTAESRPQPTLVNPSFEYTSVGDSTLPAGFTRSTSGTGTATVTVDRTKASDGMQSVKIVTVGDATGLVEPGDSNPDSERRPVQAGLPYRVALDAMGLASTAGLFWQIGWYYNNNGVYSYTGTTTTLFAGQALSTSGFATHEATVTPPANATFAQMSIGYGGVSNTVWIDNLVFERQIPTNSIKDDAVTTAKIAPNAITAAEVANGALNVAKLSDFAEAVDDRVDALLVAGTGISKTYNDGSNTLTLSATGAPAESVTQGSTLPTQPAYGNNRPFYYTGTDKNVWVYYDGTRWLGPELDLGWNTRAGSAFPITAATDDPYTMPLDNTNQIYLTRLVVDMYVATTNNGTNYWKIDLWRIDTNTANMAQINTSGYGANTWRLNALGSPFQITSFTTNPLPASVGGILLRITKQGSPGGAYPTTKLFGRRVYT